MKRELSSQAQAIVDAAREADNPSEADRKRVKGAVMAAIATGAVGGAGVEETTAQAASSGGAAGAGAGAAGVALKVLGAAMIVAGLAAGGYLAFGGGEGVGGGDQLSDSDGELEAVSDPVSDPAPAPVSDSDPDSDPDPDPDPDPVLNHEQRATDTDTDPESEKRVPRQESSLAAERELLSKARRALEEKASKRALGLLDDYARRFRGGVLLEERAAIRILALCDLGKTQRARRAAKRFAAKWPQSIYTDRIQSSCAAP